MASENELGGSSGAPVLSRGSSFPYHISLQNNEAGWRAALAISSAGFAFMGQYLLSNSPTVSNDGLVLYGVAIAALVLLAWRFAGDNRCEVVNRPVEKPVSHPTIVISPVGAALVLIAFGLAFTAVRLLQTKSGSASFLDVAVFWACSLFAYAAAFVRVKRFSPATWVRGYRVELLLLSSVTCVAAVLRLVDLGTIPATVSGDEGRIGSLALAAIRGEVNNPFATLFGHSTLYLMTMGLPMQFFGPTAFGLRVVSTLAGILTVPVTYLLGRHLFGPRVAIISAAVVAVSHIHIHFSRIAVNGGIVDALFAPIALYFLIRASDNGRVTDYLFGGLSVALHLYFYQGGRLMVIVIGAYLVALAVLDRKRMMANWTNVMALAGAFLIAAMPMIYWAMSQPQEFMARANQVGIIQTGWLAQEAVRTGRSEALIVLDQFYKAMMAFIYYPAVAFYGARVPMFDFVVAIPFVLGLAYSVTRTTDRRYLLLNVMFLLTVVLGQVALVLPEQGIYRILVIVPVGAIIAAVGLIRLVELGIESTVRRRIVPATLVVLFVLAAGVSNINYYYRDWVGAGTFTDPATRWASVLGTYLGSLSRDYKAYLFGIEGFTYGIHPSVDFLSGKMPVVNVSTPIPGDMRFVDRSRSAVFVFVPQRERELAAVQQYFPGGIRRELPDIDNRANTKPVLITYEVPRHD